MNYMKFIFGGPFIEILCFFILFILSIIYIKSELSSKRRNFGSRMSYLQIPLSLIVLVCVLKIIGFYSNIQEDVTLTELKSLVKAIEKFSIIAFLSICLLLIISKIRSKDHRFIKWYSYSNFIVIPAIILVHLEFQNRFLFILESAKNWHENRNAPRKIDVGGIYQSKYKNSFYNIEFNVPEKWVVVNEKLLDYYETDPAQSTAKATYNAMEVSSVNHLTLLEKNPFLTENYQSAVFSFLSAIAVKTDGTVYNPKSYLEFAERTSKAMGQNFVQYEKIEEVTIGGRRFATRKVRMKMEGKPEMHQEHYVYIKNKYAMLFILGYLPNKKTDELSSIMTSLKFIEK